MKSLSVKIIIILFLAIVSAPSVLAQSFFLLPSSGEYPLGREFSVSLKLESAGVQINAGQSTVNFPADFLSVKSVSKSGSIFALWPQEPVYSNTAGTISFGGGVPAPGFSGTGNILTVKFIGKKEGSAVVSVNGGVILAADGRGTNVMEASSGGVFKITKSAVGTPVVLPEGASVSAKISSQTHPDESQWYSNSDPSFEWSIPASITGVSFNFDAKADFFPKAISEGVLSVKKYSEVKDGIWYFHLRLQNKEGWSQASSDYKINVDTIAPLAFDITVDNYSDSTSPEPSLYFESRDELSGIAGYEIKIDSENIIKADKAKINPFVIPLQLPGNHKVSVWAVDNAGNKTESQKEVVIDSIAAPEILIYPKTYNAGEEIFYLEGRALPETKVIVFFADDKDYIVKTWEITAGQDGNWTLSHKDLFKDGSYHLYAKNKDKRGAVSIASEKKNSKVILKGISIGSYLISYAWIINLLWLLIILLILILIYIYEKIKEEKKRVKKETIEAEESLRKTFDDLRTRMAKKIEYMDSKPGFNHREKIIYNEIKDVLRKSEEIIRKEIEDIDGKRRKR